MSSRDTQGRTDYLRRELLHTTILAGLLAASVPRHATANPSKLESRTQVKLITLLHRKPGMSREAFIERYETIHRVLGEKYLRPYADRYLRRYTRSIGGDLRLEQNLPADVVMEIWFPNMSAFQSCMTSLTESEAQAEIVADEEKMFDRSRMVSFLVDEYESDLTSG